MGDIDGDGLNDGVEDANKDGKLGANETNPLRKDTDCDGTISTVRVGIRANVTAVYRVVDPLKAVSLTSTTVRLMPSRATDPLGTM